MGFDNSQSKEVDLERTDRLPILTGVTIDEDVEDDAVHLENTVNQAGTSVLATTHTDLRATSSLDLPSLAESVRSVEERIARQNADYDALNRLYEKSRDAQLAAGTRADELSSHLAAAQSQLAVEQHRVQEMLRLVAEHKSTTEQTRARVEEALLASERAETEARTSRDALVARDSTIAQILHSLGERDAQLSALQREHAKIVPDLEERSKTGAQLEAELKTARERAEALALDLKASRQTVADLTSRVSRSEAEINNHRRELSAAKATAESYLENLRSRVWRGGYNQNLFLEWDEKMDVARSGHSALQAECDRLKEAASAMNTKLAEQNDVISKLSEAKAGDAAALSKRAQELEAATRAKTELNAQLDALAAELKGAQSELDAERKRLQGELDAERKRLQSELDSERKHLRGELDSEQKRRQAELAAHAQEIVQARAQEAAETQRIKGLLAAAEARHADLEQQLARLQDEAKTQEEEMTVLMAHLNEARRPVQSFQADVKRLTEELAAKSAIVDQLGEDNRALRATLERTRGALEERELLIRRLERSASNNANVLGRLQTSIERLGATPATAAAPATEFTAELVRIDGDRQMTFPLGRRTRIGRAPGCELQIDSQSVSRNHAMILKGMRELIVEDLNSTNGVVVNGRRVSRNLLTDGDILTIGEIQFRCVLKPNPRSAQVQEGNMAPSANPGAQGSGSRASEARAEAAKGEASKEDGGAAEEALPAHAEVKGESAPDGGEPG